MVHPNVTACLTSFLVVSALFRPALVLASTHDLKRQAPDLAILSAPYAAVFVSSTSSFNWWPYPSGGVDSPTTTSGALDPYWMPPAATMIVTPLTSSVVSNPLLLLPRQRQHQP
ncbi:hypothetical protein BD410DRAFT_792442 [Rickenella mellea]|uniref:Secreted protein n=1 Tax=Rickenella mellea TaxID=50990 RepID=A0A4Y7PUV7_9AGAM|nr:hypothetical protein BD410DRAFT_792442 [Rickenella mellea]